MWKSILLFVAIATLLALAKPQSNGNQAADEDCDRWQPLLDDAHARALMIKLKDYYDPLQVLLPLNTNQMNAIKTVYTTSSQSTLESKLLPEQTSRWSKHDHLTSVLLTGTRDQCTNTDEFAADVDAQSLHEALKDQNDRVIIYIFAARSFPQLCNIFERYNSTFNESIKSAMNRIADIALWADLQYIASYAQDKYASSAKLLANALCSATDEGIGADSLKKNFATVHRIFSLDSKDDLICTKLKYEKMQSTSLRKDYDAMLKIAAEHGRNFLYRELLRLSCKVNYGNEDLQHWAEYCASQDNAQ